MIYGVFIHYIHICLVSFYRMVQLYMGGYLQTRRCAELTMAEQYVGKGGY